MVIFDIGLGFGIGCALRKYGEKDTFGLSGIAAGLGVAPAGLAFLSLYPDWDLQYLIPKEALPLWFPSVFCFLIVTAALLGNLAQRHWAQTFPIFCIVYGVYCVWSLSRITIVTSYSDFHAGIPSAFPASFLVHLGIFGSIATAVFVYCFYAARRRSDKLEEAL